MYSVHLDHSLRKSEEISRYFEISCSISPFWNSVHARIRQHVVINPRFITNQI